MEKERIIKEVLEEVENASTSFEKSNTDLKSKYLRWNIAAFNIIAKKVTSNRGSFGTGYPFYVLDKDLRGKIPIIPEQIRYNRQLVKDGEIVQKSIWKCKRCLDERYHEMKDLKIVCKPCPDMLDSLKPRKLINRLPDLDMWLVCEDGKVEGAQVELERWLKRYNIRPSDKKPLQSLSDVAKIATTLKDGTFPKIFLPIDAHIMEKSKLEELIEQVPDELKSARAEGRKPYLPIKPKSLRKEWQYDDEPYNFIYDYLSAFTAFNFSKETEYILQTSRARVVKENTPEELFEFLKQSATSANFRRFQEEALEKIFYTRIANWQEQAKKEGHLTKTQILELEEGDR